jgi:hypothetical protein
MGFYGMIQPYSDRSFDYLNDDQTRDAAPSDSAVYP